MEGIYGIRNKINGKIYIGSSTNIRNRWSAHKSRLKKGKSDNRNLQADFNIYGQNAFEFIIIKELTNPTQQDLWDNEQYFIDKYKEVLYNVSPTAKNCTGVKWTEEQIKKHSGINHCNYGKKASLETRLKMSIARKGRFLGDKNPLYGRHLQEEQKNRIKIKLSKPIICVETNTKYIGARDAGRILGLSQANITRCCNGIYKTCGGYHWKYEEVKK